MGEGREEAAGRADRGGEIERAPGEVEGRQSQVLAVKTRW